jgi:hypothetical protein
MFSFKRIIPMLLSLLLIACGGGGGSDSSSTTTTTTSGAPTITTQPASLTVATGASAAFSVVASGSSLTYQWYKSGTALSGETASSYTISSVTAADAGTYYVIVTNTAGSITSSSITLTISDSVTTTCALPTSTNATNTATVVAAANNFLTLLSTSQQSTAQPSLTLANAKIWSNLPGTSRNGLKFGDLTTTQLNGALAVAQAALSISGYTMLSEIRAADDVIAATKSNSPWGSGLYYIAFLGAPSTSSTWMLQLSGHHLTYNILYNGNCVGATPTFDGVEPPNWTASSVAHAPLETQRAAVSALAIALQADSAVSSSALLSSTFTDVIMGVGSDGHDSNYPLTYPSGTSGRGVLYTSLTTAEKTAVITAIEAWLDLQAADIADTLRSAYESEAALAETYVGYGVGSGGTADFSSNPSGLTSQHSYLRIDGPRVWIEFVVQQGVAYNTQVHYHTIWRDKVSDYGAEF